MRSPAKRISLLALVAVIALVPACSKDEPPTPAPQQVTPAPTPAPEARQPVEPLTAGEWEEADSGEDTSFLSADEINNRQLLRTIFFDHDKSEIRGDQRATLQANADWLREHPNVRILIEGHCDERGTREYNQALGSRRAEAARDYLVSLGIGTGRIEIVSYGEENPVVMGDGEQFWSQNRRGEFVAVSSERGTN
ncbi:MAG: peptidoglycan-associated lipoprotein Pal [Acidobacteria bacterium]|nr:peptidoglycan-associated lipoprotein Pal [Acidobacteriota bacterium]